jgi:hypothetical protein
MLGLIAIIAPPSAVKCSPGAKSIFAADDPGRIWISTFKVVFMFKVS